MLTYKIHMIRHGLTQANLEGRYIGTTDLPLCEQGCASLEQLYRTSDYPAADRVYTSPLKRAVQTAEILYPNSPIEPVEKLRELDFGDFEGKTASELEHDPAFREWISLPGGCPPHGETVQSLRRRSVEAVSYIFGQMMEKKMLSVAVVTHGGLIMNLLAELGLPQRDAVRWTTQDGRGYTLLLTAQMWMRDRKFEVYEQIPYEKLPEELLWEENS